MLNIILNFFCGIGLFLFAIYIIDSSLNDCKISNPRLENLLQKPVFTFFSGLFLSALTQSSSAINSVLASLRDKEKVKEKATWFAVAGSNIGTTATAYLAVLQNVSVNAIFSAIILFSTICLVLIKKYEIRKIAFALSGFSLIFISFSIIKRAIPELVNNINLNFLSSPYPMIPFFICLILTGLCQSSSLISVIIVTFAKLSAVPLCNALFMIMAANLGTCSTIFLVSLGKSKRSFRVALFNLFFNLVPAVVFIVMYYSRLLDWYINVNVAMDTKIALFHTIFNVVACIIVCPFIDWFCVPDSVIQKKQGNK